MNKAYKYRLYPNKEQAVLINKTFGCVRFVYNQMLAARKSIYEQYKNDNDALKQQRYPLPADYKKEFPWLKEVDSLALANAQQNLKRAYNNFFRDKSVGFPKFKSKHRGRKSYTTNNQKGTIRLIDSKTIRLPKLQDVRIKMHRQLPQNATIKSATISQTPLAEQGKHLVIIDKWYPSSKLCHICKQENKQLTLAERYWTCAHCGAELDRDENAAINIKNEGCRILGIA